jgi:hypothetical protein
LVVTAGWYRCPVHAEILRLVLPFRVLSQDDALALARRVQGSMVGKDAVRAARKRRREAGLAWDFDLDGP